MLASASVDGTMILWDLKDGSKTNILSQENGEAIRCCIFRFVDCGNSIYFPLSSGSFLFSAVPTDRIL